MALRMLPPAVRVEAVSRLYESPPEDGSEQPSYYNAACSVVTELAPELLLAHVKRVEQAIGRRPAARWSARPIDIDIALYHDLILESEDLTIPHPRLEARAFVVRPLLDLDGRLVNPATGRPLRDLPAAGVELTLVAEGEWWRDARSVGLPPASP